MALLRQCGCCCRAYAIVAAHHQSVVRSAAIRAIVCVCERETERESVCVCACVCVCVFESVVRFMLHMQMYVFEREFVCVYVCL